MANAVRSIISDKFERYAARVARALRRIPSKDWQPDDYRCRNLWDHWKLEQQEEESIMHDALQRIVEGEVRRLVDGLPRDELELLSFDSPGFEEDQAPAADSDYVSNELLGCLHRLANDEPHRREVQQMLDASGIDRYERDMEGIRTP